MARNQFVGALELFLDTADPGDLDNLAVRVKPYRITSLQVQRPDGAPSARSIPVIVLDDGRKTPEPTPTLQQHLDSLLAASQDVSVPVPTFTTPLDSFFDVTSLPWLSTDPSCLTAPGNIELPFENMNMDEDPLGDLSSEFSMSGAPGYYQDPRMPITPPYTDFFESATAPPTLPSNPFDPSTFLDTPITTPSPSSDLAEYSNMPTQANTPTNSLPETPVSSPKSTTTSTRSQVKINRRRNNNPNRPRKGHTAASIAQAILSSSASTSTSTSSSLSCSQPSSSPDSATAALVFSNCIRKDYLDFLRTNLPEWVRDGLWRSSSHLSNSGKNTGNGNNTPCFMTLGGNTPDASGSYSRRTSQSSSTSSTYGFLENIYSCVSQLDSRIETDQVRKRVALVLLHSEYLESYQDWKATRQGLSSSSSFPSALPALPGKVKGGVGRGDMTLMIDNILEQTTPGWDDLSPKRKLQLRALFHERKRYGKRWAVFREEVGCAILLVCSGQLGNMVSNTKVTMAALKQIAHAIRDSAAIMEVLSVLEPLAVALVNNDGYKAFGDSHLPGRRGGFGKNNNVGHMIRQFEDLEARRASFQSGCGGDNGAESCSDDEDMG